jgi:hypothetical protein
MKIFRRRRDGIMMPGKERGERAEIGPQAQSFGETMKLRRRGKVARGCDLKHNDRGLRPVRWTKIDETRVDRETMCRLRTEGWSEELKFEVTLTAHW